MLFNNKKKNMNICNNMDESHENMLDGKRHTQKNSYIEMCTRKSKNIVTERKSVVTWCWHSWYKYIKYATKMREEKHPIFWLQWWLQNITQYSSNCTLKIGKFAEYKLYQNNNKYVTVTVLVERALLDYANKFVCLDLGMNLPV